MAKATALALLAALALAGGALGAPVFFGLNRTAPAAPPGGIAVTNSAIYDMDRDMATSRDLGFTVPAGTDLLLVFVNAYPNADSVPATMNWHGDETMTLVVGVTGGWIDDQCSFYYLTNPTPGADVLTVAGGHSPIATTGGGLVGIVSISNVNTSSGVGGVRGSHFINGYISVLNFSPTMENGDLVIGWFAVATSSTTDLSTVGGTVSNPTTIAALGVGADGQIISTIATAAATGSGQYISYHGNQGSYFHGIAISLIPE